MRLTSVSLVLVASLFMSSSSALAQKRPAKKTAPAAPVVVEPVVEAPPPPPPPPQAPVVVAEPARKGPIRIAVYPLTSPGVEPRVVRLVEDALLQELRKLKGASVLSLDEVKTLLEFEAEKQAMGCTENSCLAEIAEALGADALVIGGLTKLNDKSVLSLKRIAPGLAEVQESYNQQLVAADGEEFLAAIGPATATLFPDLPLKPGATRGVGEELALRLHPPPLPTPVFFIGAGTSAVALAAAGVSLLWWRSTDETLQATFAQAKDSEVAGSTVVAQQQDVQTANAVFWASVGVAGAAILATVATIPFTDWNNVAGEQ